ncbi:MAG: NAD(P)-binding domain-containing protein [Planctomycetota bacterium]
MSFADALSPRPRTLIVGAGPIGLELSTVLTRLGHPHRVIDAGPIGATIAWYPKQARYFSSPDRIAIAGTPLHTTDQTKATREQYLTYLRAIVRQFQLPIQTHRRVTAAARNTDGSFSVTLAPTPPRVDTHLAPNATESLPEPITDAPTQTVTCDRLVLAIGDMHRPKRLEIPGEELPHVSHYFDDPHPHFGRDLMIVGGRNSAVEAALRCHHAGARVTLSYRRDTFDHKSIKYWLLPELEALIEHNQIRFLPLTTPTRITDKVVELRHTETGEAQSTSADAVLLLTGYAQDPALFNQLGVPLEGENRAPVFDPQTMQTPVKNLYVAGTAAAGTQHSFKLFIENCHAHAARIATHLTGQPIPHHWTNPAAQTFGLAES